MTNLNLSSNEIGSDGAVHVAEAIKVRNRVIAVVWYHFHADREHWFNCCCLLMSIEYGGYDEPHVWRQAGIHFDRRDDGGQFQWEAQ
jgi:hypothetical protein